MPPPCIVNLLFHCIANIKAKDKIRQLFLNLLCTSHLKAKEDTMKIMVTIILFFNSLFFFSRHNPADTTIKGVLISFNYSPAIFPETWQVAPILASGELIASSEIERSKMVMIKALTKYPAAALQKDLQVVYWLKSMKFYDVGYGGTNSTDALYLTNGGTVLGHSDLYLEQTFHHEYSSILYRNHPSLINEDAWEKVNSSGFDYNDPENGVGAIRNNESSQDFDTALCNKGFLTQYSLSGIENDINTFPQNIFSPSEGFWKIVDQYPRIKKKVKILTDFYNKIDDQFTDDYFKKLNK